MFIYEKIEFSKIDLYSSSDNSFHFLKHALKTFRLIYMPVVLETQPITIGIIYKPRGREKGEGNDNYPY